MGRGCGTGIWGGEISPKGGQTGGAHLYSPILLSRNCGLDRGKALFDPSKKSSVARARRCAPEVYQRQKSLGKAGILVCIQDPSMGWDLDLVFGLDTNSTYGQPSVTQSA